MARLSRQLHEAKLVQNQQANAEAAFAWIFLTFQAFRCLFRGEMM